MDDIEINMNDNEDNYLQYVSGDKLILMICNMYILKQEKIWLQEKNGLNFIKICTSNYGVLGGITTPNKHLESEWLNLHYTQDKSNWLKISYMFLS